MSDDSHTEFYSQLEDWVKHEQIRYSNCQSVLNNALDKFWELARDNTFIQGLQPNLQRADTAAIEITRSSSLRHYSRQNGRNRLNCKPFFFD